MTTEQLATQLRAICAEPHRAVVAVSGGVDSMTLAALAAQALGDHFTAFHAVSPAVPPEATARVREYAARFAWPLEVVTAGEFDDRDYLANPHNRCYFCKKNLYQRIAEATREQVFSGANTDDLGDYRPGLIAAAERQVRHPYVEAGADKAAVRALARHLGLAEVQDLPAMPCLSSRVESGIAINADDLTFVNEIEVALRERLGSDTARCRIVREGVRIELDARSLARLDDDPSAASLRGWVSDRCSETHRHLAGFARYRRGSAFLVPEDA